MRIRAAGAADLPRMRQLAAESPETAQWSAAEWQRLFDANFPGLRISLVCEEDNAVAGFLVARALERDWELENVVVSTEARRRGLGRRLIAHLIELAKAQQAAIHLEVRESNRAARALYASCGFIETGRRRSYYREPDEDAILFHFSFYSPEN